MLEDTQQKKKEIILDYLTKLPVYKWAAAAAMISEDTLMRWRADDEEFAYKCEAAKSAAIEKLGRRATPDFILKNVAPESFRDVKNVDVTSGGKPLPIMGGTSHGSLNEEPQKKLE